jgi:hypothetical protein
MMVKYHELNSNDDQLLFEYSQFSSYSMKTLFATLPSWLTASRRFKQEGEEQIMFLHLKESILNGTGNLIISTSSQHRPIPT